MIKSSSVNVTLYTRLVETMGLISSIVCIILEGSYPFQASLTNIQVIDHAGTFG